MNKEKLTEWLIKKKKDLSGPGGYSVLHESIASEKIKFIREIIQYIQSEPEETFSFTQNELAEVLLEYANYLDDGPDWACDLTVEDTIKWLNEKAGE